MLFLTLTSNNTKGCTHMMSPSNQLSSSIDSAVCNSGKCAPSHSSNPVEYISRLFWTQFIQYCLCSCLDNSSSSIKSSPHHCLLDVLCPDEKTLFLRCLSHLPEGHKFLLRKFTCAAP